MLNPFQAINSSDLERFNVRLAPELATLRTAIGSQPDIPVQEQLLGLRIWLLAEDIYAIHTRNKRLLINLISNTTRLPRIGRPRLARVATLEDGQVYPLKASGVSWTIGKGMLGQAIFNEASLESESIRHADELWPQNTHEMGLVRFYRVDPDIRQRRTRNDFRRLQERYGEAVAHKLRPSGDERAFGCVTVHVPKGHTFTAEGMVKARAILEDREAHLTNLILDTLHYRIPQDLS